MHTRLEDSYILALVLLKTTYCTASNLKNTSASLVIQMCNMFYIKSSYISIAAVPKPCMTIFTLVHEFVYVLSIDINMCALT